MKRFTAILILAVCCVLTVSAQPVVQPGAALNIASFALQGLPNGDLAQGGMFAVFVANVGLNIQDTPPFGTNLGGVSIQVTVGGTTVDCFMVFALGTQLAAILPSNTPLGAGTLTVTFNGQSSDPIPIRVVESSFGMFTRNSAGSGPAIVQNFIAPDNQPVNALDVALNPLQVGTLWGVGLGAVEGDEAAGPLPGDMPDLDIQVYVGGRLAQIAYRGRSGCCPGIDQIVFTVPEGVVGCSVPIVVVVNGVPSNTGTISIAPDGTVCSDVNGLSADQIQAAAASGSIQIGSVELIRETQRFPSGLDGLPAVEQTIDSGTASFRSLTMAELRNTQSAVAIPTTDGICSVSNFRGTTAMLQDPVPGTPLDAGAEVNAVRPDGNRAMAQVAPGTYQARFAGPGLVPGLGDPPFLNFGATAANNGNGGADVGGFNADRVLGDGLSWLNSDEFASVTRSSGVTVNWTGDFAAGEFVWIIGFSVSLERQLGTAFRCRAAAADGTFTVEDYVLNALPATEFQDGVPAGRLAVGVGGQTVEFDATGLTIGRYDFSNFTSRVLAYE